MERYVNRKYANDQHLGVKMSKNYIQGVNRFV